MDFQPADEDHDRVPTFEAAGRGDQRRLGDAGGRGRALQTAHEVEVLHQIDRPDAADAVVDRAPHEDAGIAVVDAVAADPGIEAGQPAGEAAGAVEQQAEVATAESRVVGETLLNGGQSAVRETRVGVQEQQDLALGRPGAAGELRTAPGCRADHLGAVIQGHGNRPVTATAVDHDDLLVLRLALQLGQQRRQARSLVVGRDHDRDHLEDTLESNSAAPRPVRSGRSRTTCPGARASVTPGTAATVPGPGGRAGHSGFRSRGHSPATAA